ncbi:MAG: hypothetical protein HWE25_00485 [Alphaproteobacteria bacterium]|nr:hypothetical protein [Alphaproteobacteria bacterium]
MDQGFKTVDEKDWAHVRGCTASDRLDAVEYYGERKDSALEFIKAQPGYIGADTVFDLDKVSWIQVKRDKNSAYLQYLFVETLPPPNPNSFYLTHGGIYIRFDTCSDTVVKGGEFRMGG